MCSELIVRSEQITRTVTESLHLQISIVNSICDRCIIVLEKINRFFIHRSVGNNFLQLHTTSQESYSTKLVCRVDPIAFFFDFFEIRSCFWDREFITHGAGMMSDVNFASAATVDMIIIFFFLQFFYRRYCCRRLLPWNLFWSRLPPWIWQICYVRYFYHQTEVFEINS